MISIIIPCFNIEDSIDNLLAMYKSESVDDFEVLFIDDCSTDGTYDLLCEKCKDTVNFSVLQTSQNGGPGVARNVGLENAKGEYILFCDSDDEFDIALLPDILNFSKTLADCDMFVFPYYTKKKNNKKYVDNYDTCGLGEDVARRDVARSAGQPWARLYKRSIIESNGLRFPKRMTGEDKCFVVNYVANSKNVKKSNIAFYTYVSNGSSVTHKYNEAEMNLPTTFEILRPVYHEFFPEIEEEMFANSHLLTKAKMMTGAKCASKQIHEWFVNENKKYPNWIEKVNYKNQSRYRKSIYKAMYKSRALKIKFLMFIRRILY